MRYKLFALTVLLLFLSISIVYGRYSLSIPFHIDTGGLPVGSATVYINISESASCKTPFYLNKTTAKHGVGQFNVTSSRFVASRNYYYCFNATAGSNKIFGGPIVFQPGVGDINVSRWVNGSSSRFNTYQLNNGSTFDVIYGRQDGNVTTVGITNIIYNGTGIRQSQAFNGTLIKQITVYNNTLLKLTQGFNGTLLKLVNAYNSTLIKRITVYNGTLAKIIQVYNGTLLKTFNNSNRGKTYFNNSVFFNGTITVKKITLSNGSTFDVIYGRDNNITPAQLTAFVYNGTLLKVITAYNGTLAKDKNLIKNNTKQQKLFINYTNININGNTTSKGNLTFIGTRIGIDCSKVFGGPDADFCADATGASAGILNNTNQVKTFFNNSVFFNGTIQVRTYTLRNGSSFDVIYGARPDGNVTPIGITNIIYNGTGVKLIQVYNSTLLKKFNNSNRGKTFFNNSVFFNGTIEVRTYTLRNGSNFNIIYGRDTANITPAQLTAFIYNGSLIKLTQAFNSTLLKLINAYNGTLLKNYNNSNRGKTFFNNSVFFNGTIQVKTYTLRNGSNFDVIYGRDGNVTTVGITNIIYNGTGVKLIQVYNSTLLKKFNNSNRGKTYFNNSVFFNGTITVKKITLSNGSTFDVIYGRDNNITPAQLTAFVYNGTLLKVITAYNGTLAKDKNLVKNNTKQEKLFINYTNINVNGNLTIKGNITLLGSKAGIDCTDVKGGPDSDFCVDATSASGGLLNNTKQQKAFINYTNININGNITSKGNLTFLGTSIGIDCTDIFGGTDSNFCIDATGAGTSNNTFDLFTFERGNFTALRIQRLLRVSNAISVGGVNLTNWAHVNKTREQAYNDTLLRTQKAFNNTLLKLINAYNGTLLKNYNNSNRGKTFFNNSVFFNGTIQVRTYTLRNGSSFDVIYGARPDGNVTPIGITNIIYNGTGVKLIQVYNSTLLKKFNNTNRGKTYFNNSVFFNGTIEVRTYTLRNGSNFNVIYGRDTANITPAQLTAFVYNGTLAKDKNLIKNNTNQVKVYLNSTNYYSLGNLTFVGEKDNGIRTHHIMISSLHDEIHIMNSSGQSQLEIYARQNITLPQNLTSFVPATNGTAGVGRYERWFERGFFYRLFIKRQCYTRDCTKYEEYNGSHLVKVV